MMFAPGLSSHHKAIKPLQIGGGAWRVFQLSSELVNAANGCRKINKDVIASNSSVPKKCKIYFTVHIVHRWTLENWKTWNGNANHESWNPWCSLKSLELLRERYRWSPNIFITAILNRTMTNLDLYCNDNVAYYSYPTMTFVMTMCSHQPWKTEAHTLDSGGLKQVFVSTKKDNYNTTGYAAHRWPLCFGKLSC